MKSLLTLITVIVLNVANDVRANIVELNGFRLSPFVLVKKQDFTYSSGVEAENYSAIKFDLTMTPLNTQP